ncbi:hypothetical protein K2Z83_10805 [Oscillochloris sp. ZM17-4]|uniref:hypothetical protein n=1 Tax=Oscillochloris sp. ZM17-4 TaxID=2866714 RepID=UPI001C72BC28|nr:hypothetical protein [Oscillochloris sp. ZM17-4]MBX0328167.1 hypothetical protein [Oscillochloris sp. ZM17-4]
MFIISHTRAARACLLALILIYVLGQGVALATEPSAALEEGPRHGSRPNLARAPGPSIAPYIRPDMARRMAALQPAILAAARRHNPRALSGMSDQELAAVIATILYNENFGWLEDEIAPLRAVTPLYQDLQRRANESPLGSNFSVWPANLRPSVALEILRRELPLPGARVVSVPVRVAGSRIDPDAYASQEELYAAITREISGDAMAVEYLAANLERGMYRAAEEGAPVSWRTLAAWHNQGIVSPEAIRANAASSDYVRRAAAYLPAARALVRRKSSAHPGMARL